MLSTAASAQIFSTSCPIATPGGVPIGIDHDLAGGLLFTDIGGDVFGSTTTGCVVGTTFAIGAISSNPIGVTTDAVNVYITDTAAQSVHVYTPGGTFVRAFSVTAQTIFPEGIAWSATTDTLFVIDGVASNCFEYDKTSGALLNSFPINGTSIDGIAWDPRDNTFWVYDSGTASIRHYDATFSQLSAVAGPAGGEGVALVGSVLYVMVAGTSTLEEYLVSATAARTRTYGLGCPAAPDFYELFVNPGSNDLAGSGISMLPTGGGYTVLPALGSFETGFTNNLGLTDDSFAPAQALGFTITVPGFGAISTIDVDSNGRCGVIAGSNLTETVAEFLATPMFAVVWDDFNPAAGGGVFFDTFPGGGGNPARAVVTWNNVPQFGLTDSNTFQIQFRADGIIEYYWVAVTDDALVGFSSGTNGPDNGSIDITASLSFTAGAGVPLSLTAVTRPIIGTTFMCGTANITPTSSLGAVLLGTAPSMTPLSAIGFPATCALLTNANLGVTLPINVATGDASIAIPNDPNSVGLTFYLQSAIADLGAMGSAIPVFFSNGLEIIVGDS